MNSSVEKIQAVMSAGLGLLYPSNCSGCAAPRAGNTVSTLCANCEDALIRATGPRCRICGESSDDRGEGGAPCINCSGREFDFSCAVAEFKARGLGRDLVHRFKYLRQFYLCRPLGWMLDCALRDERVVGEDWLMVPVPLHRKRRREREYNQAEEICRVVSRMRRWPMVDALRRSRDTSHQVRLDREQRLSNLSGAFDLRRSIWTRRRIAGSRIILVDDVFTTGATTNECAQVLLQEGGAREIIVATAMRG